MLLSLCHKTRQYSVNICLENKIKRKYRSIKDHNMLCQSMCEQRLSKEELNKYKRAFAVFDVTREGTITTEVILMTYFNI